jgi:hypothetical protein
MKAVMEKGVEHAQVCFVGIGDHYSDDAPIQVGQFETSDELTEKWLKAIYIEGGGGGNNGESYQLAWYFAAFHTKIDSFEKRGIKGTLITIGDEPCHGSVQGSVLKQLFGEGEGEMLTSQLLKDVQKKWDIYHINVNDYANERYGSDRKWRQLIGSDRMVQSESMESKEIGDIIASLIITSYKKNTGNTVAANSTGGQHQL